MFRKSNIIFVCVCTIFVLLSFFVIGIETENQNGIMEKDIPLLSRKSGFYNEEFKLSISTQKGNRIYYTLDGSRPTEKSFLYSEPITIRQKDVESDTVNVRNTYLEWKDSEGENHPVEATVIRVIAIDEEGGVSEPVTATYFVGENEYKNKLIVSIVADPEDLFGGNGIYVTGKEYDEWYLGGQSGEAPIPNYRKHGMEWERPAVVEMFQETSFLQQLVGIRIQGGASRNWKMNKRFSIYARKEYSGSNWFDKPLFGNVRTHSVVLRSGDTGGHIVWSGYINGYIQHLVQDRNVTAAEGREIVVYLNGARWYNAIMQEKYSEKFFQEKYGVDDDNIVIAKGGKVESGDEEEQALYQEIYDYIEANDMSDENVYERFGDLIDIQSYIDFSCVNVYFGNLDYSEQKNYVCWRARTVGQLPYEDGRWRWALYDMDLENVSYDMPMEEIDTFTIVGQHVGSSFNSRPMYVALKKNKKFRQQFVISFMDMVNTDFTVERARDAMDNWGVTMILGKRYSDWPETYFPERTENITKYLAQEFSLKGSRELVKLSVNNTEGGYVVLNTITPDLSSGKWCGSYFTDYPITLTAVANDGYKFIGWQSSEKLKGNLKQETIQMEVPVGGVDLWAVFEKKSFFD
ncbi:MAG: hypothetical protein HFG28_11440 [Eubacterium sp.]|nr:hypothetical protein [Eubacterium sp.]